MQNISSEEDQILTTSAAGRQLGVATSTVQLWMESGALASWKTPGGHRRTRQSAVDAVLERMGAGPHEAAARRLVLVSDDPEFMLEGGALFPAGLYEPQRLAAVAASGLIDSQTEERFDRIVRLAAAVTDSPIALISLLTARRQWFKARVGLDAQETPRAWAFCSHAILQNGLFVVEDAATDPRFRDNPLVVGDPRIRFYAGMPLYDESDMPMGTLCVIDREPRRLRASEVQGLRDLAEIATAEIRKK